MMRYTGLSAGNHAPRQGVTVSLTLSRMRALNAVFETGSFSSAARRLHVSQPAVTQQIRDLERRFRITLFHRQSNGLSPTPLCKQLYAVTARMESFGAEAEQILLQHRDLHGGELRIGLGNSMPGMALIRALQRHFPGLRLHVELGNWSTVIEAVVSQRVDVAILPDVPDDGRFRREICLRQGVVAIAHPGHIMARRRTATCEELIRHPLIFRTHQSSTQRVVDKAFKSNGLKPTPSIILDSRDGVFEAVANELGVGFMWEHGSSRTDKITKIAVPEMESKLPEFIFCLADQKNPLVDLFFDTGRRSSAVI